ncbi:putative uncharacterized protein C8orf44 [Plecturocebus cupreus]
MRSGVRDQPDQHALWEAKAGILPKVKSLRPAWPTRQNLVSTKNTKISQGAEVAVSQDRTTALQPGQQSKTPSQTRKKKKQAIDVGEMQRKWNAYTLLVGIKSSSFVSSQMNSRSPEGCDQAARQASELCLAGPRLRPPSPAPSLLENTELLRRVFQQVPAPTRQLLRSLQKAVPTAQEEPTPGMSPPPSTGPPPGRSPPRG